MKRDQKKKGERGQANGGPPHPPPPQQKNKKVERKGKKQIGRVVCGGGVEKTGAKNKGEGWGNCKPKKTQPKDLCNKGGTKKRKGVKNSTGFFVVAPDRLKPTQLKGEHKGMTGGGGGTQQNVPQHPVFQEFLGGGNRQKEEKKTPQKKKKEGKSVGRPHPVGKNVHQGGVPKKTIETKKKKEIKKENKVHLLTQWGGGVWNGGEFKGKNGPW